MKKKFQDWLRKQLGCPKCEAATRGSWPTGTTTGANYWVSYSHNTAVQRRPV